MQCVPDPFYLSFPQWRPGAPLSSPGLLRLLTEHSMNDITHMVMETAKILTLIGCIVVVCFVLNLIEKYFKK